MKYTTFEIYQFLPKIAKISKILRAPKTQKTSDFFREGPRGVDFEWGARRGRAAAAATAAAAAAAAL